MEIASLAIPEVKLIRPRVFGDARGFFLETFQRERYAALGLPIDPVQDNLSRSARGTLRGLHLQHPHAQGKLVSCPLGAVFDVAVDVRVGSPTFGQWVGATLDDQRHEQLWIPRGFAHGFLVLSEVALFSYKVDAAYHPAHELSIRFDDPAIGIAWPLPSLQARAAGQAPLLSAKDEAAARLEELRDQLPSFVASEE